MIVMPILGWLVTSAKGNQVMFYGFDLPLLIAQDKDLAKQIQGWHELGGTIGYWLIGLHAVAGLYHHYVVGDNTLLRMMPKRGEQGHLRSPVSGLWIETPAAPLQAARVNKDQPRTRGKLPRLDSAA